jgi:hypothetical protein
LNKILLLQDVGASTYKDSKDQTSQHKNFWIERDQQLTNIINRSVLGLIHSAWPILKEHRGEETFNMKNMTGTQPDILDEIGGIKVKKKASITDFIINA